MINLKNISTNSIVVQTKGTVASDMDGEKVLISIRNGKYYNLGKLGGVIWDLIGRPVSIKSVIACLTSEYEVEQSKCEEQVISFLLQLNKEGLIQLSEDNI